MPLDPPTPAADSKTAVLASSTISSVVFRVRDQLVSGLASQFAGSDQPEQGQEGQDGGVAFCAWTNGGRPMRFLPGLSFWPPFGRP